MKASRIIEKHLVAAEPEADSRTLIKARGAGGPAAAAAHLPFGGSGREAPPLQTLPAFYVSARDGPSPFDSHRGDYQCSVDDVWEDGGTFAVQRRARAGDEGEGAAPATGGGRRVEQILTRGDGVRCNVKAEHFTTVMEAAVATLTDEPAPELPAHNPAHDRADLQQHVAEAEARAFVSQTALRRNQLYRSCTSFYPHGALGIRESPYGEDTGEVYREHKRRLDATDQRVRREMRGPGRPPAHHMIGSIVSRPDAEAPHGPQCDPPTDHLRASVIVNPE